jgi:hypothetical protein
MSKYEMIMLVGLCLSMVIWLMVLWWVTDTNRGLHLCGECMKDLNARVRKLENDTRR